MFHSQDQCVTKLIFQSQNGVSCHGYSLDLKTNELLYYSWVLTAFWHWFIAAVNMRSWAPASIGKGGSSPLSLGDFSGSGFLIAVNSVLHYNDEAF